MNHREICESVDKVTKQFFEILKENNFLISAIPLLLENLEFECKRLEEKALNVDIGEVLDGKVL